MSSDVRVRVRAATGHGLTDTDYHEWVHVGDTVMRDVLGRRHRHPTTRWLVVVCNNPQCPGRAIVNPRIIEHEVERVMP